MSETLNRRSAMKLVSASTGLTVMSPMTSHSAQAPAMVSGASAKGNWLMRGQNIRIINLEPRPNIPRAIAGVVITNVIGDKVKVHVLDNPEDTILAPGESILRHGSTIFIEPSETGGDELCIAYGTFEITNIVMRS